MFRVSARTVLQLGAELISSDTIAFYELIKNAFDAGSPQVVIRVIARLPQAAIQEAKETIAAQVNKRNSKKDHLTAIMECRESLQTQIDSGAPMADKLRDALSTVDEWDGLKRILDEANFIEVEDTGTGMSLTDLKKVFLTIGTRSRLKEKDAGHSGTGGRTILGEKGIGRLSAMRLGGKLRVNSTCEGEKYWNVLEIDWRLFSHDSDALLEEIDIEPTVGEKKADMATRGTCLMISAPSSDWNVHKLEGIADQGFSKLTDPFVSESEFPIRFSFNGQPITIQKFDRILFNYSHAEVAARFEVEGAEGPRLVGKVNYKGRSRENTFALEGTHLVSAAKLSSLHAARALGPFTVQFSWFNRKALRGLEENIEEVRRVIKLQALWAGGLMVYRDGFRVYPYGSPEDDWLDLDKKAFGSGGYKVNRRQLIGKVNISSAANPALLDQSNREGLCDSSEKQILVFLLKYVVETEFRGFINHVDKEVRANEPITFDDLEERIEESEEKLTTALRTLVERYPMADQDAEVVTMFRDTVMDIRRRFKEASALADSLESKHAQVVHHAATGMLMEMLAHELNRATANALASLTDSKRQKLSPQMTGLVNTLQADLKTLQRRLRILDPLSTAGRHRKETFDLVEWIKEVMATHDPLFQRHSIRYDVHSKPEKKPFKVKAVRGMILQIIGNLISNSVYWLKQERKVHRSFKPEISIIIDATRKAVLFSDNGPGIPIAKKEEIFQAFVTTKPPGEGKGLGLYVAREVARYHHATLILSDKKTVHTDRLNTFIFTMEDTKE